MSGLLCIALLLAVAGARDLHRRHNHVHPSHYELEDSVPRELSLYELEKRQLERLERLEQEQQHISLRKNDSVHRFSGPGSYHLGVQKPRRKRHNGRREMVRVSSKTMNEEDVREYISSMRERDSIPSSFLEVEVKHVQNSSVCNYTVVPDRTGIRIPRELQHIKCNHIGSECLKSKGFYCCIQTYSMIEVAYATSNKRIKHYNGCVCSYQRYPELMSTENLSD